MQLKNGEAVVNQASYTYDNMSRLAIVSNGNITANYARIPGFSMLKSTTINNGLTDVLTTTKSYNNLNRLVTISSVATETKSYTYDLRLQNFGTPSLETFIPTIYDYKILEPRPLKLRPLKL